MINKKFLSYTLIIVGVIGVIFGICFSIYTKDKEITRLKEQVEIKEKYVDECYNIVTDKNAYVITLENQIVEKDKTIQDSQSKIEELETKNRQLSNEVNTLKKN